MRLGLLRAGGRAWRHVELGVVRAWRRVKLVVSLDAPTRQPCVAMATRPPCSCGQRLAVPLRNASVDDTRKLVAAVHAVLARDDDVHAPVRRMAAAIGELGVRREDLVDAFEAAAEAAGCDGGRPSYAQARLPWLSAAAIAERRLCSSCTE